MALAPGNRITVGDMGSLAGLANSKATLPGKPYTFSEWAGDSRLYADNPKWLTELHRLRDAVSNYVTTVQIDLSQLSVSGAWLTGQGDLAGWPIAGPQWYYHDQWFYFADTGGTVNVTVGAVWSAGAISAGKFATRAVVCNISEEWDGDGWGTGASIYADPPQPLVGPHDPLSRGANLPRLTTGYRWNPRNPTITPPGGASPTGGYEPIPGGSFDCLYGTAQEWSIIIGGTKDVTLTGRFYVHLPVTPGQTVATHTHGLGGPTTVTTADPTNPIDLISVDSTANFPGTFTKRLVNEGIYGTWVFLEWDVNQTISPGRYTAKLNFDTNGDDSLTSVNYYGSTIDPTPGSLTYGRTIADPASYDQLTTVTTKTRISGVGAGQGAGNVGWMMASASITWGTPTGGLYPAPTISGAPASISVSYSEAVSADGIHGTTALKKIALPDSAANDGGLLPAGIYCIQALLTDPPDTPVIYPAADQFCDLYLTSHDYSDLTSGENFYRPAGAWIWSPFPQPVFTGEKISIAGTWAVTTSTPGFWTGITGVISNLNPPGLTQMPWNYTRRRDQTGGGDFIENPMLLANAPSYPASGPYNSYDGSLPVEQQPEPPVWKANTPFTLGFTIIDLYGNFQKVITAGVSGSYGGTGTHPAWPHGTLGNTTDGTVVWTVVKVRTDKYTWQPQAGPVAVGDTVLDSNGHYQVCVQGGTTSGPPLTPPPTWATGLGDLTNDGSVVWKLSRWPGIKPAAHRVAGPPRYPVYWFAETIAALKPPTTSAESEKTIWGCGCQWQRSPGAAGTGLDIGWQQDNMAKGWWLYSVGLNRMKYPVRTVLPIGAGSVTVGAGAVDIGGSGTTADEISVTLGCIRSGVFVPFGTYTTGQVIRGLWPIFTSDALVYQCSERLDVQALAIGVQSGGGVAIGGTCAPPLCAAFAADLETLLNKFVT